MAPRKSPHSTRRSQLSQYPPFLGDIQEENEEDRLLLDDKAYVEHIEDIEEVNSQEVEMLSSPLQQRPSRLKRFSTFLPMINIGSKLQEDTQGKILRKQVPAQYEYPQPSTNASTRLSLSAPTSNQSAPLETPSHPSNRLQKPGGGQPQSAGIYTDTTFRERGNSLVPPTAESDIGHGRSVSNPLASSPTSYHSEGESGSSNKAHKLRRLSWVPGGNRSRNASRDLHEDKMTAWVNGGDTKLEYNCDLLLSGSKVSFPTLYQLRLSHMSPGTRALGRKGEPRHLPLPCGS